MTDVTSYSSTPLVTKIGVRDGHVVLLDGAPDGFDLAAPTARVVRRLPRAVDVTLTFHTTYTALAARLPVLLARTSPAGMVWVCWPKKSAQKAPPAGRGIVSDLDDGRVRALGLELGFVDVKVAAIDEVWSGLKFVRRLGDR